MRSPLLLISFLLFTSILQAYQFDTSVSPTQFASSIKIKGRSSTLKVDIFGIQRDGSSPVVDVINAAFRLLSEVWRSRVVLTARITFTDLGRAEALASGGGVLFVRFDDSPDQELVPIAAAEAITGRNLNRRARKLGRYDILIKVNTQSPWNVDLNRPPLSSEYDLFTVLLHEAYHNLLFSGAIGIEGEPPYQKGHLLDGYPARFDLFLANEHGCAVLDYLKDKELAKATGRSNARLFAQAVTNDRLYFFDTKSRTKVPLYAPMPYRSKSSIYHIDTERGGTAGVMNRFIPLGFMERKINKEMRKIQKALLDPTRRGARHCPFPLEDPSPRFHGNSTELSSEPMHISADSFRGVPKWVIAVACIMTLCLSLLGFCCFSKVVSRKNSLQESRMEEDRFTNSDTTPNSAKRFSTSSSELLIDEGISYDEVEIDIRDIEIDEEDNGLFEHNTKRRYTLNSTEENE